MKKMIEQLREAKTWQECVTIAEKKYPGTPFDNLFIAASAAKQSEKLNKVGNRDQHLKSLGTWLASVILTDKTGTLHDIAKALDVWNKHKPKPNYELIVLFSMVGMFPPGWRKFVGIDPKKLKPIYGKSGRPLATRDIMCNLSRIDPNFSEDNSQSKRRKILRYAKWFNIVLDDTPGRPAK